MGLGGIGVALLLVGIGGRTPGAVDLPGALPPVPVVAVTGLALAVAVVVTAVVAPRWRAATRVLLSGLGLAAAGLGLALLDGAPPATTLLAAALAPVVLHLAVVVAGRRRGVPAPLDVRAGSCAGLVVLIGVGVGGVDGVGAVGSLALASVVGAALLALPARGPGRSRVAPPTTETAAGPEATDPGVGTRTRLRSRTDLLPALGLALVAVLTVVAGGPSAVAPALGVAAVAAGVERLARWRARGQLEVLARWLTGTVLAVMALAASVGSALGPRAWAGSLVLATLLAVAVAARAPRPPAPPYTRATHLRVVRALPGAVVGGLLAAVALTLALTPVPTPSRAGAGAPGPVGAESPAPVGSAPSVGSAESVGSVGSVRPGGPAGAPTPGPSMRIAAVQGTTVQVVVSSASATDALEVRTRIGSGEVSYPLVSLTPGAERVVEVTLPERGRFEISLHVVTSAAPLQTLVVQR